MEELHVRGVCRGPHAHPKNLPVRIELIHQLRRLCAGGRGPRGRSKHANAEGLLRLADALHPARGRVDGDAVVEMADPVVGVRAGRLDVVAHQRVPSAREHHDAIPARDPQRGREELRTRASGDGVIGGAGGREERRRHAVEEPSVAVVRIRDARVAELSGAVDEDRVVIRGLVRGVLVVGAPAGVVAHRLRRKPHSTAEEPEGHVVVVVVAPVEPAACRRPLDRQPVEVDAPAVHAGLEPQRQIAAIPRRMQRGRPDVGEEPVERQRVWVGGRDRRVVADELEHVVPELGKEVPAADGVDVPLRGRLCESVAEPRGNEAADLHHHLARPVCEVAEGQNHLPRRVRNACVKEEEAVPAQKAHVRVVGAGAAHRLPEGQRHGEPIPFVRQALVPGPIRDEADRLLQHVEVALREGKPVGGARVLPLQHQRRHPQAGRVDPVVVLQVLVDPPRVGHVRRDLLRLDADPVRDRRLIRRRQRLVDPVVRDGVAEQHVGGVQVRAAEIGGLAVVPAAPVCVGEKLAPGHRGVLRVARHLVRERPDRDLVPEEPVVVVVARRRRRVVEVLIEDGGDVRGDRRVRRLRGLPQGRDVGGAEEQRRMRRRDQG